MAFSTAGILHVGDATRAMPTGRLSGSGHHGDAGPRQHPLPFRRRADRQRACSKMSAPPALWGNALYEFSALVDADEDAKAACQTVMLGDLMRSGVTTHLDIASPHPKWLSLAARERPSRLSGARLPRGAVALAGRHRLDYRWDEAAGARALRRSARLRRSGPRASQRPHRRRRWRRRRSNLLRGSDPGSCRRRRASRGIRDHDPCGSNHGGARGAPAPNRRDRAGDA